jgi:hypothetical protein
MKLIIIFLTTIVNSTFAIPNLNITTTGELKRRIEFAKNNFPAELKFVQSQIEDSKKSLKSKITDPVKLKTELSSLDSKFQLRKKNMNQGLKRRLDFFEKSMQDTYIQNYSEVLCRGDQKKILEMEQEINNPKKKLHPRLKANFLADIALLKLFTLENPFRGEKERKGLLELTKVLDSMNEQVLIHRQDELWRQYHIMAQEFPNKCRTPNKKKWFLGWLKGKTQLDKAEKLEATRVAKTYASIIFNKIIDVCENPKKVEGINYRDPTILLRPSECDQLFVTE